MARIAIFRRMATIAAAVAIALCAIHQQTARAALRFSLAPDIPNLGTVTLTGQQQTIQAALPPWEVVDDTASGLGWHVTVQADSAAGKSPVLAEYCTDGTAANGCDTAVAGAPGPGYVTTAPRSLPAGSLLLDSTAAVFTPQAGTTGSAPVHACAARCKVDSSTPVTIASAAAGAGAGTWRAESYSPTSVALTVPTSARTIGTPNKAYRIDLVWTLASGPA